MKKQARTTVPKATPESQFTEGVVDNLYHTLGQAVQSATKQDVYTAVALTVRDHLITRWRKTTDAHYKANPKFIYYLSAEYLLGKQLEQNLLYTGTTEVARGALAKHKLDLDELTALDPEPGLGNGGLGRLAACFIDSLATLGDPLRVRDLRAMLRGRLAGRKT